MLRVVQLRLHGGRQQLDDLDVGALQLLAQHEDQLVQRGLAGAVVGAALQRHEGEARGHVDERGGLRRGLQEGEEGFGQGEVGEVVGCVFFLDAGDRDGFGLGEVEAALDAGVKEDAVEVGVGFGDAARGNRGY